MENGKQMILHIDLDTGKVKVANDDVVVLENDEDFSKDINERTITDANCITIIGTHNSPGCRYVKIGGRYYRVCH